MAKNFPIVVQVLRFLCHSGDAFRNIKDQNRSTIVDAYTGELCSA
jgi:hypothetical protein